MPRQLAPCGTVSAYQRHCRLGEPIDDACREARRTYSAQLNARRAPQAQPERDLHRRLDRQAQTEREARAGRLLVGIRDEHWGQPWWLDRHEAGAS